MAQHDYVIANQGFPAFRSDLNNALAAVVSNNSGATEPATMFAHQIWVDTAADPSILKIRNADNDAWITIGTINQTGDTFTLTSAVSATTLNTSGAVVFNDAGADVDFRVEGDTDANLLFVDASADAVGIGTGTPIAKLQIAGGANPYVVQNSGRAVYGIDINATAGADGAFGGAISLGTGGTGRSAIAAIQGPTGSDDDRNGLAFFVHTSSTSSVDAEEFMRLNGSYLRLASGTGGIQFNGDTAAANALDDYEEGTWTPVLDASSTSPAVGYALQSGRYTKVGRLVTISGRLSLSSISGGSGNARITGLPFTVGGVSNEFSGVLEPSGITFSATKTFTNIRTLTGTTQLTTTQSGSVGGTDEISIGSVAATADFVFAVVYIV